MSELSEYQFAQLTNQSDCFIHTHPQVVNYRFPHGAFSHTGSNQTASINTATAMQLNNTDVADGIALSGGSKLYVPMTGVYNLQFSAQLANSDTTTIYDASIWFAIDGTNVANSNTMVAVHSKHGGVNGHAVAAWNIFLSMTKGQYAEIYWSTPNASLFLEYTAAQVTPTRPATPSVIVTMNLVSD